MRLVFELPLVWQLGLPVAFFAMAAVSRAQWQRGVAGRRTAASAALRGLAFVSLVLLAARPVWVEAEQDPEKRRSVVLLVDRSESMSLEDHGTTRSKEALAFAREQLLPAIKAAELRAQALLFAEDAQPADGRQLAAAVPDGKRTNLAGAILRALGSSPTAPLAVVALTDGAATENADNSRALAALVEAGVPFVGVGFGSETGARTLSLRQAIGPPVAPASQEFQVSAQLEAASDDELPPFDLVLMRDGQFVEKKTVSAGKGSRVWLESFAVTEKDEGFPTYTVQLLPPAAEGLRCVNTLATAAVRIASEKNLRVLFVQGALTWDYKFIKLALKGDPTIKLTGLSRTTSQSVFYQNIESTGELAGGFPTKLEEIAPFRVVVLSNLRPADLSAAQQELLARFCGEFGGGVLMIGGADTFDRSWQGSRLEQLLPVRLATTAGSGPARPFRADLTAEALDHPVFQISEQGTHRAAWAKLPAFTQYARVDSAKPGALVWARHSEDTGPDGRRILIAAQRYGSGVSAVICVQNFWRWRLAKDSEPQQYDRFWQQLFRHLGEGSQEDVAIRFPDQELRPQSDIRVVLEKRPNPKSTGDASQACRMRVEDAERKLIAEQAVELAPGRPVDVSFRTAEPGVYTVTVVDPQRAPLATRTVEVRETNVEFEHASRNMENLRQWAALTDGVAIKAEDCQDAAGLVATIVSRAEQKRRDEVTRVPAGVNGWVLALLLASLGGEWLLRKKWGLT